MEFNLPPSAKPQMVRAVHEWCVEQGYAPYLLVQVDASVSVPLEFVKDGTITLNTSYDATGALSITNEMVSFKARFGGVARDIFVPLTHVMAIFARESGQGVFFSTELEVKDSATQPLQDDTLASSLQSSPAQAEVPPKPTAKSFLTVVK